MASAPPIYQPTDPAPRAMPLPQRTPDESGAQIGAAVEGLGASVGGAATEVHDLQTQQQTAAAAAAFAKFNADQTTARINAQADGTANTPDLLNSWDQGASQLQGQFTSPMVSKWLTERLADGRGEVQIAGATYDARQRGAQVADDMATAENAFATPQVTAPDLAGVKTGLTTMAGAWDAAALPDEVKLKGKRESAAKIIGAYVDGMNQTGQATTVQSQLTSGMFDPLLDPEHRERLGTQVDTQIRTDAATARTALELKTKAINQAFDLMTARQANGEVLSQQELSNAKTAATAIGEPAKAYDFGAMMAKNNLNQETQSWLPQQYSTEINRLVALGDNAAPADEVRLHQLQEIAPKRIEQINKDPWTFGSANGMGAPATIDLNSGQGFAARSAQRQALSGALGGRYIPTLLGPEAANYIDMAAHGSAAQKLQVAQMINQWGGEAPNVLRQIVPDTTGPLAQAIKLGITSNANMQDAITGAEVDKSLPFMKPNKDDPNALVQLDPRGNPVQDKSGNPIPFTPSQIFQGKVGPALRALDPTVQSGAEKNAENMYAAVAFRGKWNALHGGEMQNSASRALGGVPGPNGEWFGGIGASNGVPMVLPATVSQRQFDQTASRSTPQDYANAAGGAVPSWGNRPATPTELQGAVKTWVGGDRYMLAVGNSYMTAAGSTKKFVFSYRALRPSGPAPMRPTPAAPSAIDSAMRLRGGGL